jgi:hypothetical protein
LLHYLLVSRSFIKPAIYELKPPALLKKITPTFTHQKLQLGTTEDFSPTLVAAPVCGLTYFKATKAGYRFILMMAAFRPPGEPADTEGHRSRCS